MSDGVYIPTLAELSTGHVNRVVDGMDHRRTRLTVRVRWPDGKVHKFGWIVHTREVDVWEKRLVDEIRYGLGEVVSEGVAFENWSGIEAGTWWGRIFHSHWLFSLRYWLQWERF